MAKILSGLTGKISYLIYFACFILLFSAIPIRFAFAQNGSLYLEPGSESFSVGETFSVKLMVDAAGIQINAAESTLYFPADRLEVMNISKENSIFSLWPQDPVFSNLDGKISFTGGLPHPGFKGSGIIITIEFKAKKEGEVILTFDESRILADDGQGTNILSFLKNSRYLIYQQGEALKKSGTGRQPVVSSLTHPKQDEWYSNNTPGFQWNIASNIKGVSYVLDKNPQTIPGAVSMGLIQSKNYDVVPDGIWYFHLRFEDETGWTDAGHYQIHIDTQPPHKFEIIIDNGGDPTNPNPNLYFETNDDTSGIDKYRIKIGDENFFDLMTAQVNPFTLRFPPGNYRIIVRAVDKAYNIVRASAILNIDPIETPKINVWPEKYIGGQDTFYTEGTSLPEAIVTLLLRDNGKEIKRWQTESDSRGQWFFSTKQLIKPGVYALSAMAQDKRGASSNISADYKVEAVFNGFSVGGIMLTSGSLILILLLILFLVMIFAIYFSYRNHLTKKILQKEIKEAEESLVNNFSILKDEIEKKVSLIDSQPELNKQEKELYENIKKSLYAAEESISKEIKDIEKEVV
jgi:hypothetical protein